MGVAGVILAAEHAARLDRPKALLDFRGQPFVVRILQALEALEVKLRVGSEHHDAQLDLERFESLEDPHDEGLAPEVEQCLGSIEPRRVLGGEYDTRNTHRMTLRRVAPRRQIAKLGGPWPYGAF